MKKPMSIVTVKNKYQVVIPRPVREQLGINRGDILEAKAERGKLTYTPKAVLDRIPANKAQQFFQQFREEAPEWLKASWEDAKRKGVDKLSMRQIDAEIAASRRERQQQPRKKKIKQPVR
jgi:AbrB family looped-hinge helix DNA binding protein